MGQNPIYFKIDKLKGLPSNSIYDITQDRNGFMWFATDEGLCQYDGKKITVFQNKNQNSKSGSCLVEDHYGRMWYSNFDGKLFFVSQNKLVAFTKNKPIGYSKFGILGEYLCTLEENKINIYNIRNFKLQKSIRINSYVGFVSHASNSNFYAIADGKLYIISKNLAVTTLPIPSDMKLSLPMMQDVQNQLYLVSNGKTLENGNTIAPYCYVLKKGAFVKYDLSKNTNGVFQNVTATPNAIWICTTTGAYQLGENNIPKAKIFEDFNITSVYKDRFNQYWFSTNSNGILLVPKLENQFFLTPNPINQIEATSQTLFFGTSNDQIYQTNFQCTPFDLIFKGTSNHDVGVLRVDEPNQKTIFTSHKFMVLGDYKTKIQEEFIAIKDIAKLDNTYYSFAATGLCGLLKISNQKSSWDSYYSILSKDTTNAFANIKRIITLGRGKSTAYNPHNKTIYFASGEGLFSTQNGVSKELKHQKQSLFFTTIRSHNDEIIGLTSNGDLYRIDVHNSCKKWNYLPYTKGELAKKIHVTDNTIYLFTNLSVYEYSWQSQKSTKVFVANPEFELNDLVVKNNYLYFGSSKGILKIKKSENSDGIPPKIIVNEVKANDKSLLIHSKSVLESDENTIAINFSVLNFIPNQKNEVYYKINQQDWKLIEDESRQLLLNSLAAGEYQIHFKTQNNGVSSTPIIIRFQIKNPIWLQWWFLSAVSLFMLFFLYQLYRWKIRKMEVRNQQIIDRINLEKNVNQSKLKAIKSQMNPHFFYNALNTIQSFILSNDKKLAVNYLSKFSTLTRTILEMTEKEWVTIAEEKKTLSLYLDIEKARFDADFDYEISVASNLDAENLKIPSMLLQPYVENAIKHGLLHKSGSKKINITFTQETNFLKIEIDDNGIGRKKSQELNSIKNKKHNSFATEAMQNRIDLLNQTYKEKISITFTDKENENHMPIGTLVTFHLPLHL